MRLNPMPAAVAALGALALWAIPATSGAIVLNGVQCDDFTITGTTTNGVLNSDALTLEIHDCGDTGCDPFSCGNSENCGNGQVDAGEQCDGSSLGGQTCQSRGFSSGTLLCNNLCQFDTSLCAGGGGSCGDGQVQNGEQCDGGNLSGQSCQSQGFDAGTLRCNSSCQFDTGLCSNDNVPNDCPDGFLNERVVAGQNTYGVQNVAIPPGTTRTWCMDVNAPLVPTSQDISRIYLSWGDQTDYVCGVVEVQVQQSFSPFKKAGPSTGTSGNLRFSRSVFRQPDCPECVARGRYIVTARGVQLYNPSDPRCQRFTLTWGVN